MSDKQQPDWAFGPSGTKVSVQPGTGDKAAAVCATAYTAVDKIRQTMVAAGLTTLSALSNFDSGISLADEYRNNGLIAYGILGAICDILSEFGQAFIWAENKYKTADEASARFVQIRGNLAKVPNPKGYSPPSAAQLADIPANSPITDSGPRPDHNSVGTDLSQLQGQLDKVKPGTHPELGIAQWEVPLRKFSTFDNSNNSDKADAWHKMTTDLAEAIDNFGTDLRAKTVDWVGDGRSAALHAADTLCSSIVGGNDNGAVITGMKNTGNTLHTVIGHIDTAEKKVHEALKNYDTKLTTLVKVLQSGYRDASEEASRMGDIQKCRQAAISAFDSVYCSAINKASKAIPTLTAPANPLTAVGGGSGNGNGQSGSGAGDGYDTGNFGTGSGFGSGFGTDTALRTAPANPYSANNSASNTDTPSGDSSPATDLLNQAQQGMQALSNAAQSAAGAAKDPAQDSIPDQQPADQAAMDAAAADTALASQLGTAAGNMGPLAASASKAGRAPAELAGPKYSKLFPRAGATAAAKEAEAAEEAVAARAGAAPSTAGTPGTPGAAARGAGAGQEKSHRQRENLISGRHLDEALGQPVIVGVPIVED